MILLLIIVVLVVGALLAGVVTGGAVIGLIILAIGFIALITKLLTKGQTEKTVEVNSNIQIQQGENESLESEIFFSEKAQRENDDKDIIIQFEPASDREIPENIKISIERAYIALNGFQFDEAKVHFDRILDVDPHFAPAYMGKLLCKLKVRDVRNLAFAKGIFTDDPNWGSALRFATAGELETYNAISQEANAVRRKYREQKQKEKNQKEAKEAERNKRNVKIALAIILIIVLLCVVVITILVPLSHYNKGVSYRDNGKWSTAVWEFEQAGHFKDAEIQILETKYQEAASIYKQGDYSSAYLKYLKLVGYKDVDDLLKSDKHLIAVANHIRVIEPFETIGGSVLFGHYQQERGSQSIEWIVLNSKNGKSLLLSKYGLYSMPYDSYALLGTSWANSPLRDWLNTSFFNYAFKEVEKTAIIESEINNGKEQGYHGNGINSKSESNTMDHVFLLSYAQANNYLGVTSGGTTNIKARVAPTNYAKGSGARIDDEFKTEEGLSAGWWWLRSSGGSMHYALGVGCNGSLTSEMIHSEGGCIRPAIWVDLEADYFWLGN